MARKGNPEKAQIPDTKVKVGFYEAFDGDGNVIWSQDEFRVGVDKIPYGLSMGMKAMRITDPKSGDIIAKWNPWHVL